MLMGMCRARKYMIQSLSIYSTGRNGRYTTLRRLVPASLGSNFSRFSSSVLFRRYRHTWFLLAYVSSKRRTLGFFWPSLFTSSFHTSNFLMSFNCSVHGSSELAFFLGAFGAVFKGDPGRIGYGRGFGRRILVGGDRGMI